MATTKIREAIEYLKEYGWIKGHHRKDDGSTCLIGSMMQVRTIYHVHCKDMKEIESVIKEQYPDRNFSKSFVRHAEAFNDHPSTTLEEVLAVMEKAAVRREECLDDNG